MTASDAGTVLIVEDNQFNRRGLVLYLEDHGYTTLEAADERTALQLAYEQQPSAAILDIVIPARSDQPAISSQSNGLNVLRELKARDPALPVVVFSAHEDRGGEVWRLVRDGMRGVAYLLKGTRPERILQALESTAAGHVILEPDAVTNPAHLVDEMRDRLTPEEAPWVEQGLTRLSTLTEREWEVVLRLTASQNNRGIAEALHISERTADNHVSNIYSKLGYNAIDKQAPTLRKSTLLAKACLLYELSAEVTG